MDKKPAYEDILEIIARFLFENRYIEEAHRDGPIKTVDNMCSSMWQIGTGVLSRISILKPIDDIHRRHVFICEPDAFKTTARTNRAQGCSYDTVVLSLMMFVEDGQIRERRALDSLKQVGLVESWREADRSAPIKVDAKKGLQYVLSRSDGTPATVGDYEKTTGIKPPLDITWTKKKEFYDELYADWPSLIGKK